MARRGRQLSRISPSPTPAAQGARVTASVSYSGPLPLPADLERYDAIVPGMAERLRAKFEQQADHRMALENHVIRSDVRRGNWGLAAAFVFGLAVLAASVALILNGHEGAGTTALLVEFVTFGGLFLYGNETRRRERNKKAGG